MDDSYPGGQPWKSDIPSFPKEAHYAHLEDTQEEEVAHWVMR